MITHVCQEVLLYCWWEVDNVACDQICSGGTHRVFVIAHALLSLSIDTDYQAYDEQKNWN